jgi:cyclopropane fatty-acyl-phospholipid synthase-like methyltransferase
MTFWVDFWAQKTDGLHRHKTEEFFRKQADEVLHHLNGGDSLLDFGCGSAELLVYYAERFHTVTGVDFSSSMLEMATQRMKDFGLDNVKLLQGDEATVWPQLDTKFDRIIACGVVQYMTLSQIDALIRESANRLNEGGRIILFTFIEPALLFMRKIDAINSRRSIAGIIGKAVQHIGFSGWRKLRGFFTGDPVYEIGYSCTPRAIEAIAGKYGLEMECVWSIYYEYRYHAILTPKRNN